MYRAAIVLAVLALTSFVGVFATPATRAGHAGMPDGLLTVDGRGPFDGQLGTHCFFSDGVGGCADVGAEIVPTSGPDADARAAMRFELDNGWTITSPHVDFSPAADDSGQTAYSAQAELADGAVHFTGPRAGDWVIAVSINFEKPGASGDAVYYFRVHAGPPDSATVMVSSPSDDTTLPWLAMTAAAFVAMVLFRRRLSEQATNR